MIMQGAFSFDVMMYVLHSASLGRGAIWAMVRMMACARRRRPPLSLSFSLSLSPLRSFASNGRDAPPLHSGPREPASDRLRSAYELIMRRKLPCGSLNPIRSETEIVNIVEQRIIHSMMKGEFENLEGQGKPLQMQYNNPHADPTEDLLYGILAKNDCAPQWVVLNKEIRESIRKWRSALQRACKRNKQLVESRRFGGQLYSETELKMLEDELKGINRKVLDYNLIVPFGRQVLGYKFNDEFDLALKEISKEDRM